jgi:hypothetical protein
MGLAGGPLMKHHCLDLHKSDLKRSPFGLTTEQANMVKHNIWKELGLST